MEICKFEGCERQAKLKGHCDTHYNQKRRTGKTFPIKSPFQRNAFIFNPLVDYVEIVIQDKDGKEKYMSKIDKEDYDLVKCYRWCDCKGYVWNKSKNKTTYLHQLVLGVCFKKYDELEIDHKNTDTSDNRKTNLRICNNIENGRNRGLMITNKSGYKGVSWHKKCKKWKAEIMHNKESIHLGVFNNKLTAAFAYNRAADKYHGEFAFLNVVTIPINEVIHEPSRSLHIHRQQINA